MEIKYDTDDDDDNDDDISTDCCFFQVAVVYVTSDYRPIIVNFFTDTGRLIMIMADEHCSTCVVRANRASWHCTRRKCVVRNQLIERINSVALG